MGGPSSSFLSAAACILLTRLRGSCYCRCNREFTPYLSSLRKIRVSVRRFTAFRTLLGRCSKETESAVQKRPSKRILCRQCSRGG